MLKIITLAIALALAPAGAAQTMRTEIIELGYTSAADLVPVLKPLVSPPGSVSGLYTTLIIKATPENLADILLVIQRLDAPPNNLMITVRHGISDRTSKSAHSAGVVVEGSTKKQKNSKKTKKQVSISGTATVLDTRSRTDGNDTQRIRVLEGKTAFIRFGESIPVAQRSLIVYGNSVVLQDSIDYVDVGSGFHATPRLNGDIVTLAISPERSNLNADGGGVFDVQAATTTVSGRLGEWIDLGGVSNQSAQQTDGTLYSTNARDASTHSISIRVERVN